MDEAADEETDGSDDEEAMETEDKNAPSDVPMETDDNDKEKEATTTKAKAPAAAKPVAAKPVAVASGLPQSQEELESLISAIHQSVNNNVLPRLHKCLTAKVHTAHRTDA